MGNIPRIGDLQVGQDLEFQRREWVVERIGWGLMALLVIAALFGLLGGGPLSQATAGGEGGPFQVQYGRFVRHRAPTDMEITLQPGAVQEDKARVWVDREWLDTIDLQSVLPEPDSMQAGGDRLIYVFELDEPGAPASIKFDYMPVKYGARIVSVGLDGGESVSFNQVVYP